MSLLRSLDLGRREFGEVEAMQEALRTRILGGEDAAAALLIVEHLPVVTLGRRAGEAELRLSEASLAAQGISVQRASRGGEATYHGPGQLVAYPIMPLRHGVVGHVEALAAAVVRVAAAVGVEARFDRARPGVWVAERKLASIGVHVHRRVAIHGVAMNVGPEALVGFRSIVPCGMPDVVMTCLEDESGGPLDRGALRRSFTLALLDGLDAEP